MRSASQGGDNYFTKIRCSRLSKRVTGKPASVAPNGRRYNRSSTDTTQVFAMTFCQCIPAMLRVASHRKGVGHGGRTSCSSVVEGADERPVARMDARLVGWTLDSFDFTVFLLLCCRCKELTCLWSM